MLRLLVLALTCGQLASALRLKLPPAHIEPTSSSRNHFEVKAMPKIDLNGPLDGALKPIQKLIDQGLEFSAGESDPMDLGAYTGIHHPMPAADRIRLLNMNTWYGGNMVLGGTQMIANAIDASNPHLVVLQEIPVIKHLQLALAAKGKMYHIQSGKGDVALLSKWPIEKVEAVPGADDSIAAYHINWPWGKLVVGAAHLDWEHFSPAMARGYDPTAMLLTRYDKMEKAFTSGDPAAVQAMLLADDNSKRGPQIQAWINYAKTLPKEAAVILSGDFNEPSHLDWTTSTSKDFDHNGLVVPWRRSQMLSWAGFRDSYREKFPDPKTHPGMTWPAHAFGEKNTGWTPGADERERVDFVYHNDKLTTVDAGLMGGNNYWVRGGLDKLAHTQDNYPMDLLPWPSDHKGLFVEFTVVPQKHQKW